MPRLSPLTPQKVIKILEKKGFVLDRVSGSHHIYYHPEIKGERLFLFIRKICPRALCLRS